MSTPTLYIMPPRNLNSKSSAAAVSSSTSTPSSLLVVTLFPRNSPVKFLCAGWNATVQGLPFTLLTLVLGWWGIPWGLTSTPRRSIYKNLNGGTDIITAVLYWYLANQKIVNLCLSDLQDWEWL